MLTQPVPVTTSHSDNQQRIADKVSGFRPDIEGLRAIAVLLVILFHAGLPFVPGGYVGVDVFFVISGFLVTGLMIREMGSTGKLSMASFYARRARRLIPMATTTLLVTLLASCFVLSEFAIEKLSMSVTAASTFWANWYFAASANSYFATEGETSPVLHFWSLSVEEQFYLILPLILIGCLAVTRSRRFLGKFSMIASVFVITAVSYTLAAQSSTATGDPLYFGTQTRLWELGIGSLLAFAVPLLKSTPRIINIAAGWIGVFMVAWAAFTYTSETPFPGPATLLPVGGAALVLFAGISTRQSQRWSVARPLSVRPMQYIGARSYNLYLWHWPVLILVAAELSTPAGSLQIGGFPTPYWAPVVALAITVVLTAFTYRFIEQPMRNAKLFKLPRVALSTAAAAIVVTVCAAQVAPSFASNLQPELTGTQATVVANVKNLEVQGAGILRPECQSSGRTEPNAAFNTVSGNKCILGNPNGAKKVAVLGDSHLMVLQPALQRIAKQHDWALHYWGRNACWYAQQPDYTQFAKRQDRFTSCAQWNKLVSKPLEKNGPYDAIILIRAQDHYEYMATSDREQVLQPQLNTQFGKFAKLTKQLVVIQDPPRSATNVPRCLLRNRGEQTKCQILREAGLQYDNLLVQMEQKAAQGISSQTAVSFIPLAEAFCEPTSELCPVVDENGVVLLRDQDHLTNEAAIAVTPVLAEMLAERVPSIFSTA